MDVAVFGVVNVYGCHPLQGLLEPVLQARNGLFGKLSDRRVFIAILALRVEAYDEPKKVAAVRCLVNHGACFSPLHFSIGVKQGSL
jgi:hypothetical protein